jgi:F0F1-type ATP synthase delta subunit
MEIRTIDKLQEALEKLLGAYEELQMQKELVDDENVKLKDQNDLLNSKIFEYERTDGEKDEAIGDMLDKIETVLDEDGVDNYDDNVELTSTRDESIVQNRKDKNTDKLELNRLDNLMEGFL